MRSATARWGLLNSATTVPVVVSQCTFDLATANGTTFPSAEVIIPLGAGGAACPGRPPGAFGWLDTGVDTQALAERLAAEGWLIAPGHLFFAQPRPGTLMRVNFASAQDARFWRAFEQARDGLRRPLISIDGGYKGPLG